jgi:hypothetical protein
MFAVVTMKTKAPSSSRFEACNYVLVLIITFALGAGGCRTPPYAADSSVTIDYEITPQPPHVGPATVTLKILDAAGDPVPGASVHLEGNMTHAGMAPTFAEAHEITTGKYRATLDFSMGGDWIIVVGVVTKGGKKIEKQLEVKGVAN